MATARDGGRPFGLVLALFFSALGGVVSADRRRAATCATEAAAVARERGFRQLVAMADVVAGWAAADADRMRRALADFEASGSRMLLHLFHGLLGEVEQRHGRRTKALECVGRALRESEATGERFWEAELHRLRAELLLAGPAEESVGAHESFERALARRPVPGGPRPGDAGRREPAAFARVKRPGPRFPVARALSGRGLDRMVRAC